MRVLTDIAASLVPYIFTLFLPLLCLSAICRKIITIPFWTTVIALSGVDSIAVHHAQTISQVQYLVNTADDFNLPHELVLVVSTLISSSIFITGISAIVGAIVGVTYLDSKREKYAAPLDAPIGGESTDPPSNTQLERSESMVAMEQLREKAVRSIRTWFHSMTIKVAIGYYVRLLRYHYVINVAPKVVGLVIVSDHPTVKAFAAGAAILVALDTHALTTPVSIAIIGAYVGSAIDYHPLPLASVGYLTLESILPTADPLVVYWAAFSMMVVGPPTLQVIAVCGTLLFAVIPASKRAVLEILLPKFFPGGRLSDDKVAQYVREKRARQARHEAARKTRANSHGRSGSFIAQCRRSAINSLTGTVDDEGDEVSARLTETRTDFSDSDCDRVTVALPTAETARGRRPSTGAVTLYAPVVGDDSDDEDAVYTPKGAR